MAYEVHGSAGSGSVAVEAALTLIGAPYRVVDAGDFRDTAQAVAALNPLRQQPVLTWTRPDGGTEVMTESAAILIHLAECYPEARLAPLADDPDRPRFLRWMSYVSSAIYSLFWISDGPQRLVGPDANGSHAAVRAACAERVAACWRMMESQIEPGRFLLGPEPSVLDLYVAVVSRFTPRRARFEREAPRMGEVMARVDALPALERLWAERMPFEPGWKDR